MTDKEEDRRFYAAYAQAVVSGLERLQNRTGSLTPQQEAELAVNKIALGVLEPAYKSGLELLMRAAPAALKHATVSGAEQQGRKRAAPVSPDWSNAERRDCAICFAERVPVMCDPDGLPRCADCWEDLKPCVICGTVSTRQGGHHYCHPLGKDQKND